MVLRQTHNRAVGREVLKGLEGALGGAGAGGTAVPVGSSAEQRAAWAQALKASLAEVGIRKRDEGGGRRRNNEF